jgi:hypothetical protein
VFIHTISQPWIHTNIAGDIEEARRNREEARRNKEEARRNKEEARRNPKWSPRDEH